MKKFMWLSIVVIFLFSCEKDTTNSKSKGTIEGKVARSSIMTASSSLDSIMVILIDGDFEPDTIECENDAAFIDTVYTDTSGTFVFENVEEGNYYIYPVSKYNISSTDNPLDNIINISDDDYIKLSYVAEPISLSGIYQITVNLKNYGWDDLKFVNIYRKNWICFVPAWDFVSTIETDYSNGVYSCTFGMGYGYSLGVYTLTNAYKLGFSNKIGIYFEDAVYEISTPITNTPSEVEFDIDASTGTVTRIK